MKSVGQLPTGLWLMEYGLWGHLHHLPLLGAVLCNLAKTCQNRGHYLGYGWVLYAAVL